jgi:prevent-host-death family protein
VASWEATVKDRSVGIRELKSRLSECVREVKRGATIVVTEHGRRVARLVPETEPMHARLESLKSAGTLSWSGRRLRATTQGVRRRGERTVADILVENRG